MHRKQVQSRDRWFDRYQPPTLDDLRAGLERGPDALFDYGRKGLQGLDGVEEVLSWEGIPWRWCLVYRLAGEPGRPLAYLVPDPDRPHIALPLTDDVLAILPVRRFSKSIRDRIVFASEVSGVHWAQWDLASRALIDEIMDLARRVRNHRASPVTRSA